MPLSAEDASSYAYSLQSEVSDISEVDQHLYNQRCAAGIVTYECSKSDVFSARIHSDLGETFAAMAFQAMADSASS